MFARMIGVLLTAYLIAFGGAAHAQTAPAPAKAPTPAKGAPASANADANRQLCESELVRIAGEGGANLGLTAAQAKALEASSNSKGSTDRVAVPGIGEPSTPQQKADFARLCEGGSSVQARCFNAGVGQGLSVNEAITYCRAPSQHCVQQASSARPPMTDVDPWKQRFHACNIGPAPTAEMTPQRFGKTACGGRMGEFKTLTFGQKVELCGDRMEEAGSPPAVCYEQAQKLKLSTLDALRLCTNYGREGSRDRGPPPSPADCYAGGLSRFAKQPAQLVDICRQREEPTEQAKCLRPYVVDPKTGDYNAKNWEVAFKRCFG